MQTDSSRHSVLFSILIFQTTLLIFYPYFSFDEILSPLICLSIVVLGLSVSSHALNHSQILMVAGCYSIGLFHADFSVLQESPGILFFTQIAFFQICAVLLQSPMRQRFFLSIFLSALTTGALYGLWQVFFGFQQGIDFYTAYPEAIPENFKNDSILLNTFLAKLNNPYIYSVFTNPNIFAGFLLCGAPAFFLVFEKQKNNILLLTLLSIPCIALFFTQSRSAGLLFLFYPIWKALAKTPGRKFFGLLFLFSITLLSVFYLDPWKENLPFSFQSRLNYWESTWKIIRTFPGLGCGLDSFQFEFLKHLEPGFEVTRFAHNHWLQKIAELGIPAGLFLIGWVLWILSSHRSSTQNFLETSSLRCLVYPALGLAVVFVFFFPFTIPETHAWILVASALFILGLALLFFRLLKENTLPFLKFSSAAASLLFLHSLVEFNLDTLALGVLFFGFLGILAPQGIPSKREFYLGKIFQGVLLLGIFFTVSHIFGNLVLKQSSKLLQQGNREHAAQFLKTSSKVLPWDKEIAFQEALLHLEIAILKKSEDIPKILERYWKMAEQFKDYHPWMTLAKLARDNPDTIPLRNSGIQAIEKALLGAPANERLHLLKAQLLAQHGNPSQSKEILKKILSNTESKKWGYIFSLNNQEKQEAQILMDSLHDNKS
jgi:hypothetical protein